VIYQVLNKESQLIGQVAFEDPLVARAVTLDGHDIETWARDGVPSLQGSETALGIEETQVLVSPADEFWGLAFLEEAERRDWTVQEAPAKVAERPRSLESVDFRTLWPDTQGHDDHGRGPGSPGSTRPVALGPMVAKHPGMEMVDVRDLHQFRTQDRRVEPKGEYNITEKTETLLPRLTREFREGKPVLEPLEFAYDHEAGKVILIDGNTRLAAIEDAGFTHAPVIVRRQNLHGFGGPAPKRASDAEYGGNWVKPSAIGLRVLPPKNPLRANRAASLALALLLAAPSLRALWPDKTGKDDHGRDPNAPKAPHSPAAPIPGSEDWFASLVKKGGAKGSNPGGTYEAPDGTRWYVKEYSDPAQGAAEVLSSAIYNRLGLQAPVSVLGKGGRFASRWMDGVKGTVGQLGLTKERADEILDGFAADVFTVNWDAVGTGLDNVVVTKDGYIARVDQGGTLLHRAQGALKPEGVLTKIGEWDSLRANNHYYASVFSKAGINGGDALGTRAVAQIDRITAARPEGGWRALAVQTAPRMPSAWHDRIGAILEARHALLKEKREQLAKTLGIPRAASLGGNDDAIQYLATIAATLADGDDVETLYALASGEFDESKVTRKPSGISEGGEFTSPGDLGGTDSRKKKAKAATTEQIDKAWEMYQQGKSYAQIQAATGLNPKQAATIIFKIKKKQKEAGEAIVDKTNELSKFGAGGQKEAEAQVAAEFAKQGEEAAIGAKLAADLTPATNDEAHVALLKAGFTFKEHEQNGVATGEWHWIGPDGEEYGPETDMFSATNIALDTWNEYKGHASETGENSAGAKVAEILEGAGYEWKQDTTGAFGADMQAWGWVAPYGAYFGKQDWGSATDKNAAAFAIAQNSDYGVLDNVINKKIKMGMTAELKKLGYEAKLWSPDDPNSSTPVYKWTGPDGVPIGESFAFGQGGKASALALSQALANTGGAFAEEGSGFSKVVEPPAQSSTTSIVDTSKIAGEKVTAILDKQGYVWEKNASGSYGWKTPTLVGVGTQKYGPDDKDLAAFHLASQATFNTQAQGKAVQAGLSQELQAAGYSPVPNLSNNTWQWQAPDGTKIGVAFKTGEGLAPMTVALQHAIAAGKIAAPTPVSAPGPKTPSDAVPAGEFQKMAAAGYKVETVNDVGGQGTGWQWVGPKGEKIGPVMTDVEQMKEVSKAAHEHFLNPPKLPDVAAKYTYTSIQNKDNAVTALQEAGLVWKKDYSSGKFVWVDKNGLKLGDPKSYTGGATGSAIALIKQNPSLWRDKANEGVKQAAYAKALQDAGTKWGYDSTTGTYGWYKKEDMGDYSPIPGAIPIITGAKHSDYQTTAADAILAGGLKPGSAGTASPGFATVGKSTTAVVPSGGEKSKLGPNATKTAIAEEAGYEWKLKETGPAAGKDAWAWFQNGIQVSAFQKGASADHVKAKETAAATINFGAGPTPKGFKAPPAAAPTGNALLTQVQDPGGPWPIADTTPRVIGGSYPTVVKNAHQAWLNSLTDTEREAIRSYTNSGYSSVNAALRQNPSSSAGANIKKGLDKSPNPPPPELVWRGVSHTGFKAFMAGLSVGDTIRMDGFQSTSISPSVAVSWGGGGTLLEIKPKRGAYVKLISSHPEYEYLLPHGQKYRFRGAKQVSMNGTMRTVLQLEML
jgi:hypothetical protein